MRLLVIYNYGYSLGNELITEENKQRAEKGNRL